MILFKDRRTGDEVLLKGVALTPANLATSDLGIGRQNAQYGPGIGDLHKVVPQEPLQRLNSDKRQDALWDVRVPNDLRQRIIDMKRRTSQLPDGFSGGSRFHKDKNGLTADIVGRDDLPAKLQRQLLQIVHDNAPISPLSPGADRNPGF